MIYRNHKEYKKPPKGEKKHEALQRWLRGEAGMEALQAWLATSIRDENSSPLG